ncbi:MAG: YIP1 family protein [Desulfobacterales bacterium]
MTRSPFNPSGYFHTLAGLLVRPAAVFEALADSPGIRSPLVFLAVSALFSGAAATTTAPYARPMIAGTVFVVNDLGMPLMAAGLAYLAMVAIVGRRVRFGTLLAIHALASGVTLLISWVPVFVVVSEPWKWWLVWTGLRSGGRLGRWAALAIVGLSIGVLILLFHIVIPWLQTVQRPA